MHARTWAADSRPATAALAVLIGTLAGLVLVVLWARSESGYTVEILGSGDGVSVLITHQHRHVLIVSGSDGPEFANALASAFSPLGRDIELLLISGHASSDVIERTQTIATKQTLFLSESNGNGISVVQDSMLIPFSDDDALSIGLDPEGTWIGTITVAGIPAVTIAPSTASGVASQTPLLISLDRHEATDTGYSAIVGPADGTTSASGTTVSVHPGQSIKIDLSEDQLRIPRP